MSDSPILNKMDALMKKHRGGEAPVPSPEVANPAAAPSPDRPMPPADAWLPVLTQVIERGTPPAMAAPTRSVPPADMPSAPTIETVPTIETAPKPERIEAQTVASLADTAVPDAPPSATHAPAIVSSELSEQLMSELTPRLSEVMEKQLAAELRKNLDQTVATLLSQLDVNVREIVRDAVAEKLRQSRDPSN